MEKCSHVAYQERYWAAIKPKKNGFTVDLGSLKITILLRQKPATMPLRFIHGRCEVGKKSCNVIAFKKCNAIARFGFKVYLGNLKLTILLR